VSVVSAGCLLWLERLQPVFGLVAAVSLTYESWLVWRRPPHRRTPAMIVILWASIGLSGLVLSAWMALWLRYR
jgi:hypothetical protein